MTPDLVAADLAEVVRQLEEVHPDFVDRVGREAFDARVEAAGVALTGVMDGSGFWWAVAPLVAAAGDGHTELDLGLEDVDRRSRWSVEARGDRLWVNHFGRHAGPLLPDGGAWLASVEGVPGEVLLAALRERVPGETQGLVDTKIRQRFPYLLAPAVRALQSTASIPGYYRVVVELPGGRVKEAVVATALPPSPAAAGRGYLNVRFDDAEASPWPTGADEGWVVAAMHPRGAGARAGLALGDLVVAVDGVPTAADAASARLAATAPGEVVPVTVHRAGEPQVIDVSLGEQRPLTEVARFAWGEDALWVRLDAFEQRGRVTRALDAHLAEMPARGIQRVIVDLRGNPGGEGRLAEILCARLCTEPMNGAGVQIRKSRDYTRYISSGMPWLLPLAWPLSADLRRYMAAPPGALVDLSQRPPRLRPGPQPEVTVLVDDGTYSAGVYLTGLLQRHAGAEVWGSGPGSASDFHGMSLETELSATGVYLVVASATFRADRGGPPTAIEPDVPLDPDDAFQRLRAAPPGG